ncbi:MAG: CapA family protein [Actinomycetia bacterium]|nr:CapA family protein [Actinomycetes bacterium]
MLLLAYYLWIAQGDVSATGSDTTLSPTAGVASRFSPGGETTRPAVPARTAVERRTSTTTDAATTTSAPPTTTGPSTTTTTEPPTTTTTEPSTTTTTEPPALLVAAAGDVLGERGPGLFMDKNGGAEVFAEVRPFLETAMLAFVNVEGPISDKGTRASWKEYTFRGRPVLAEGLAYAGIDVISLANNHSMDYGGKALLDTFVRLDEVGVQWAGPSSFEAVPIYLDEVTGVPAPVTGEHAAAILDRLAIYSTDLGLQPTVSRGRAYFGPGPAALEPDPR